MGEPIPLRERSDHQGPAVCGLPPPAIRRRKRPCLFIRRSRRGPTPEMASHYLQSPDRTAQIRQLLSTQRKTVSDEKSTLNMSRNR